MKFEVSRLSPRLRNNSSERDTQRSNNLATHGTSSRGEKWHISYSRPVKPVMSGLTDGREQAASDSLYGDQIQTDDNGRLPLAAGVLRDPARFTRYSLDSLYGDKTQKDDNGRLPLAARVLRDSARFTRDSLDSLYGDKTQKDTARLTLAPSTSIEIGSSRIDAVNDAPVLIRNTPGHSFLVDTSTQKVRSADVENLLNNLAARVKKDNPELANKISKYSDSIHERAQTSADPANASMSIDDVGELSLIFDELGKQLPSKALRQDAKLFGDHFKASWAVQAKKVAEDQVYDQLRFMDEPGANLNANGSLETRVGWDALSGAIADKVQIGPEASAKYTKSAVIFPEDEALLIRASNHTFSLGTSVKAKITKFVNLSAPSASYSHTHASKNETYLSAEQYAGDHEFRKAGFARGKPIDGDKKQANSIGANNSSTVGLNDFSVTGKAKKAVTEIMSLGGNTPFKEGAQAVGRTVAGFDPRNEIKNVEEIQQKALNQEPQLKVAMRERWGIDVGENSLGAIAPTRKTPVLGTVSTHNITGAAAANINIPGAVSLGVGGNVSGQKTSVRVLVEDPLKNLLVPTETLPEHMREAQRARKDAFQQMERNIEPLLSKFLVSRFPELAISDANHNSSEATQQTPLSKATPEQLMVIIEEDIVPDMNAYTDTVIKYDGGDKSLKADKHILEDKWGAHKKETLGVKSRAGRHAFLQAVNMALTSAAMRIRDQHSVSGDGDRIDPAKERDYQEYKTKIDATIDSFDNPKFKYDRKTFQNSLTFLRTLPINITAKKAEFNFAVSSLGQGEGPISGLTGGGGVIKVSTEAAKFDHWSPYQAGVLHNIKIELPAGLSVGFGAAGFEDKLKELGVNEPLASILQGANVSLGADMPKVTIHIQRFDADLRKQGDYPGKPGTEKDFTRVTTTMGVNGSVGGNMPLVALGVPVPGLYVGATTSAGASVTKVAKESIGTDSLGYTMKRGSRMHNLERSGLMPDSQTTGKLDETQQWPQFLHAHKSEYIEIFSKLADKGSRPFEEAFLHHVPEQLTRQAEGIANIVDKLVTDNQLDNFFLPGQKQEFEKQLNILKNAQQLIINQEYNADSTDPDDRITPEQIAEIVNQVNITVGQIAVREANDFRANIETKSHNENLGLTTAQIEKRVNDRTESIKKLSGFADSLTLTSDTNQALRSKSSEFTAMTPQQKQNNFEDMLVPFTNLVAGQIPYWQDNELQAWKFGNEQSKLLFDTKERN